MKASSTVKRASSSDFRPDRTTAADARPSRAPKSAGRVPPALGVVKLRGCRVSAPLMQPWGQHCRIIEWIDRNGELSCIAVPDAATEAEIRERVRSHRNGLRHTVADDSDLPPNRARLRRA